MWFQILGPVRVTAGPAAVPVTARREQTLLAMLLLHLDQYVPAERLVDAVWADRPPRDAAGALQAVVYRLRKRLAGAGGDDPVVTEPGGYRLRTDPGNVDLWEFRRLVAAARTAAAGGESTAAAGHYRTGLGLWRGPALAGAGGAELRRAAAALDEERVQAQQECAELELALGRTGELVPELTELVRRHPYREGLATALGRALYLAGRPADALTTLRRTGQLLRDELGTEPGPELQWLQRAIQDRSPALGAGPPAARPVPAGAGYPVPRELPASVPGFTGRAGALAELDRMLPGPAGAGDPVAVSAITGMAGVGKPVPGKLTQIMI